MYETNLCVMETTENLQRALREAVKHTSQSRTEHPHHLWMHHLHWGWIVMGGALLLAAVRSFLG